MEEFRDLDNYYSISNEGRVKSRRSGKILKTHSDSKSKGYEYITLNYNGVKKTYQVHRLAARLLLPDPNNYPCVNHMGVKQVESCTNGLVWKCH